MYKKILFFLISYILPWGGCNLLLASNAVDTVQVHSIDYQSEIWVKTIDSLRIQAYQNQKEFQYDIVAENQESFLDIFLKWLRKYITLDLTGVAWFFIYSFLLLLSVGIAILILHKQGINIFKPKNAQQLDFENDSINPEGVNWGQKIETAVKQNDFRLAIRFHYLWLLKELSAQEIILWRAEKTNYDYAYEISDKRIRANFEDLIQLYESVWYGEFATNERLYKAIEQDFKHLVQLIKVQNN